MNLKKNNYKIFLFHGVVKKNNYKIRNYLKKHILEKEFHKCLKDIKKNYNLLSLKEIIFNIKHNLDLPNNTCAITFDDGFENNYSVAAPILDDLKMPTTFFFSTDFIENNTMSWIDKIEFCFEKKNELLINLPWLKKKLIITDKKTKIQVLNSIRSKVKNNFFYNEDKLVRSIFSDCNLKLINNSNLDIDKKISWRKVKTMSQNNLFDFGGHNHHHLSFGAMSKKKINFEINKCFELFLKKGGIKLECYSYPEGQSVDFNQYVIKKLKNKKIMFCPTAIEGINNKMSDFFKLKRTVLL